jgi:hypothetical protein
MNGNPRDVIPHIARVVVALIESERAFAVAVFHP